MKSAGWFVALLVACSPAENGTREAPGESHHLEAIGYAGGEEPIDGEASGVTLNAATATAGITYVDTGDAWVGLDLEGNQIVRYEVPGFDRIEVGLLMEDGDAILLSTDQGVARVSRAGEVRWRVILSCHHDLALLDSGDILVPVHTQRSFLGRQVRFDGLMTLSPDGQLLSRLDLYELRGLLAPFHDRSPLDTPAYRHSTKVYDYYHLNSARQFGDDWLLCLRNVDLVVALDPVEREVTWSFGPGTLDAPHHPTLTPEGNILIFDNGRSRGWSRVLEFDPDSAETRWEHRGFFTDIRGSAQRLASGNTLVTVSQSGLVFEVTPEGERVWEWRNPLRDGDSRRHVYRAWRR